MRNTPEEFGLLPDGDKVRKNTGEEDFEIANSWSLGEVLTNSTFWVFIFGRIISPAWGTGLIFASGIYFYRTRF